MELLNRKAIKKFDKAKDEASLLKFDELSVIKIVKKLYDDLQDDNLKAFVELAKIAYKYADATDDDDEIDEMWVLGLLDEYNPVTLYIYDNEVIRKRERTAEAINSSTEKSTEFHKGLKNWAIMTDQYAVCVTDRATLKAFKDAGIKRVRWNTIVDGHECKVCRDRDGKIYPIDKVPDKVHWGDRCFFTAVL